MTEATVLTNNYHPVSIFSEIHSSKEKDFTSINDVTFSAMEQDYVIRLTARRKLLYHNKWVSATELRSRRKGKVKLPLFYKGKEYDAYLSHVKVQITASRKDIYLVLVYDITEYPMMLATNKKMKSKEDVINVALAYFSRWKIEEYFRCKKQMFRFENFRVRKLAAINALNFYITLCMAFLTRIPMKLETNAMKVSIIQKANPVKEKVQFCYYRLAKGISSILSYAKEGIRLWFRRGLLRCLYSQDCHSILLKKVADWHFGSLYSFFDYSLQKLKDKSVLDQRAQKEYDKNDINSRRAVIIAKKFLLFRVVESEGTGKPRQPQKLEGAGLKRAYDVSSNKRI